MRDVGTIRFQSSFATRLRALVEQEYLHSGLTKIYPPSVFEGQGVKAYLDFRPIEKGRKRIENYYDSDPFDYRDPTFLHEDGTLADYGDVVRSLVTDDTLVHITTAGWPSTDKLAKKGAEKVVELYGQSGIVGGDLIRISVNSYELRARQDLDVYRADMEQVIQTLAPISPQIQLFYSSDDPKQKDYEVKVVTPIMKIASDYQLEVNGYGQISRFSGPMETAEHREVDEDVMACMPGFHIWPDGTITHQDWEWNSVLRKQNIDLSRWRLDLNPLIGIRRGTRPTPIGINIFR